VPQAQLDQVSQNLLPFFPLPNVGTNLFSTTQTLSNNTDQFGVKVDHYLDPRDTLNFRYMFNQLSQVDPLSPGGASVPDPGRREPARTELCRGGDAYLFAKGHRGGAILVSAEQISLRGARKP
jgi:hypothetical protein